MKKIKDCDLPITDDQLESLARCLLPTIQQFFESDEGKREFEGWKKQQERLKKDKNSMKNNEEAQNHVKK